jgi:hypothetical protein
MLVAAARVWPDGPPRHAQGGAHGVALELFTILPFTRPGQGHPSYTTRAGHSFCRLLQRERVYLYTVTGWVR